MKFRRLCLFLVAFAAIGDRSPGQGIIADNSAASKTEIANAVAQVCSSDKTTLKSGEPVGCQSCPSGSDFDGQPLGWHLVHITTGHFTSTTQKTSSLAVSGASLIRTILVGALFSFETPRSRSFFVTTLHSSQDAVTNHASQTAAIFLSARMNMVHKALCGPLSMRSPSTKRALATSSQDCSKHWIQPKPAARTVRESRAAQFRTRRSCPSNFMNEMAS